MNNIVYFNDSAYFPQCAGNVDFSYSCSSVYLGGTGNITDDPLFVNPEEKNFELQSGSPCIDAGDPESPLDPDGTIADMGALYFDQMVWAEPISQQDRREFALHSAYPNPFNATTVLSYKLQVASQVILTVYDLSGRKVADLVDGWSEAGTHAVTFDGSGLPSGVYIYRLDAGEYQAFGKMVLMN